MVDQVTQTQTLSHIAAQMAEDIEAMRDVNDLSPELRDVIESPAPAAMLRELERFGVTGIEVPDAIETLAAQDRIHDYMIAGAETMQARGIPAPHLEDYYAATGIAAHTGLSMDEVVGEFQAVRPIELGVPGTDADLLSISTMPEGESVQTAQSLQTEAIPDLEPQDYTEYDVHFMMYPLAHDIAGTGIETRPSHAFIVVTEKGVDPLTLEQGSEDALIVTRAGPDRGTYDFWFDTDVQSPTDNNRDGDVYVKDQRGSEDDLSAGGIRLIETSTIRGDIEGIRENVQNFRFAVNSTDINYHAPWQNSNTYAGDVYENLTGKEAPDTIQWPHYMPGLGNDLPVEGDFSYNPQHSQQEDSLHDATY